VGLAGNVVNASLGYCLIYGHAGLPALGVRGCGTASAISECLEALVLGAIVLRDVRRAGTYARARAELSLGHAMRELAAIGVPTALQFGSEYLAIVTLTAILGGLAPEQIAAHQIAMATIRASFLPGVAVSEAGSVLVGQALGRRDLAGADRVLRAALFVAVSFMASCGVVFALAGGTIAAAFTDNDIVARVVQRLLWIAAAFQVLDAVSIVLRGALRGAKDVRVPAIIGITVIWTFVPTAALILGRVYGWGAAGGWLGFLGETTVGACLCAWRWRHGAWRSTYANVAERSGESGETTARARGAGAIAADTSARPARVWAGTWLGAWLGASRAPRAEPRSRTESS
jgi:MATE family multidrug resistance protein